MKNLWKAYLAWTKRREQKQFERWRKTRAKGKARFVLTTALWWGGLMIALYCLTDYYDGVFRVKKLPFRIIFFLIGGLILGLVMWWTNEATYKGKAPPGDEGEAHIK